MNIRFIKNRFHQFPGGLIMLYRPQNEEGQGLVEYALILVLVAVVVIVILAILGPAIANIFSNLVANFNQQ